MIDTAFQKKLFNFFFNILDAAAQSAQPTRTYRKKYCFSKSFMEMI